MTRSRVVLTIALLAALLAAGSASAGGHVSAQVGGFVPWDGDAGVMTSIQVMGSNAAGRSRWGGEFEYRSYQRKIQGVDNVDSSSYVLRGLWQYHFRPDALVTPYVGLGMGLTINAIDDDKVEDAVGSNARDAVGAGLDGVFMLGIAANIPGAEYISVFAEGRVGLAFDAYGQNGDVDVDNVGGGSGSAGRASASRRS
jgi:hypothetical protein